MLKTAIFDALARYYDLFTVEDPADAPFYARFIAAADDVLEIGVGTGRLAEELAQLVMFGSYTGIDNSNAMLQVARDKMRLSGQRQRINLRLMDMRGLNLTKCFDVVLVPYLTFQFALTTRDQMATLSGLRRVLKKDGCCLVHLYHPDHNLIAMSGWRTEHRQHATEPGLGREVFWLTRSKMDRINQLIRFQVIYRYGSWTNRNGEIVVNEAMRYTFRYEMEHMAERCGLRANAVYGDFKGRPLRESSRDMIFLLRKIGR